MSKLIMLCILSLFSIVDNPKQSNEDTHTKICYWGWSSQNGFGVQITNKQAVSTSYSITWPNGITVSGYPPLPAGQKTLAFYTAPFVTGTLSATPTVGGGTVAVYVASTLGHDRCN